VLLSFRAELGIEIDKAYDRVERISMVGLKNRFWGNVIGFAEKIINNKEYYMSRIE
jgi:hypothetical protein